jgi:hypothetical protein
MATIKDAKLNGAELLRELAKTGTSDAKLALPRQVLSFIHRKEKRVARADELIDAMEKAGVREPFAAFPQTPELTLKKAMALATTGRWDGPTEAKEPTVEELILAGQPVPEEVAPPVAEEAVTSPAESLEGNRLEDALALKPVKKPAKPVKKLETAAA